MTTNHTYERHHLQSTSSRAHVNKMCGFELQAHSYLLSAYFLEISDINTYAKQPDSTVDIYDGFFVQVL